VIRFVPSSTAHHIFRSRKLQSERLIFPEGLFMAMREPRCKQWKTVRLDDISIRK